MTEAAVAALSQQVLWAAFVVSGVFGWVSAQTNFCTMGAISDWVLMGSLERLRQWAAAIAVAMLGFATLVMLGWVDPKQTLYASNRVLWLSGFAGGALFGFGMVLASGCGSKTLVRIGSGNLKSLVVFVFMGVSAFATLKGITAVARVASVDQVALSVPDPASIGAALGLGPWVGLVIGAGLLAWCLMDREFRSTSGLGGGVLIGCCVAAMWWVSGRFGYVAEHPETLQAAFLATASGRVEALSFVAPASATLDWLMFFSDKSKVITVGVASVAGVLIGSAAQALRSKSFRWEGFRDAEDTALHIGGATLMGVGGVTAMGCTVGQGLSGISSLSLMSVCALAGIVLGAVAALKWQMSRLGA